jgi:hypothetical protein
MRKDTLCCDGDDGGAKSAVDAVVAKYQPVDERSVERISQRFQIGGLRYLATLDGQVQPRPGGCTPRLDQLRTDVDHERRVAQTFREHRAVEGTVSAVQETGVCAGMLLCGSAKPQAGSLLLSATSDKASGVTPQLVLQLRRSTALQIQFC